MNKFSGPFKIEIKNYLNYRENILNLKTRSIQSYLEQFDKYTIDENIKELNRENIEKWLTLRENENRNTLRMRAYSIKCFAKYLNLIGIKAYIIDSKPYQCKSTFIPHIFTDEEIKKFFNQIDKTIIKNNVYYSNNRQQLKLFFKTLYCCGLRDSELINIKYNDIDFNNKTILIRKSKNEINRLIYLNDDLINDFRIYVERYYDSKYGEYLFYNAKTKTKRHTVCFRVFFHHIIDELGFKDGKTYRLHDFRHTFAVKTIKALYEKGEDVNNFLPVLMTYMGHSDIISTEYYLRFIPEIYEKVTNQFENYFKDVIPNIGDNHD